MGGMKVSITGNLLSSLVVLVKKWPSMKYGLFAEIGYEGRRALYEGFLRGQVIDLRKYPYGKDGKKRTVNYAISKRKDSVKISSYPLNLYNPRSVYNSARSVVESRITKSLNNYDERVLQKRLDRIMGTDKK